MATSTGLLGLVERNVCVLQQRFHVGAVARKHGDAHARGNAERLAIERDFLGHGRLNPLCKALDRLLIRQQRGHDDELVAAHSRHEIESGDRATQPLRDHSQQLVARRVPARVVDVLEMVEVQVDQRQRRLAVDDPLDQLRHPRVHEQPVRQAGQKIPLRLFDETATVVPLLLFGHAAIADVALLKRQHAQHQREHRASKYNEQKHDAAQQIGRRAHTNGVDVARRVGHEHRQRNSIDAPQQRVAGDLVTVPGTREHGAGRPRGSPGGDVRGRGVTPAARQRHQGCG